MQEPISTVRSETATDRRLSRLTGTGMVSLLLATAVFCIVTNSLPGRAHGAIEAVKGKRYTLTKQHGPWMIMVTTLTGSSKEQYERALKSADELVHELRLKGIPAYVYLQDARIEHINTTNRMGQQDNRIFASQRNNVGILAGNYPNIDDPKAQQTLKFVKQFRPKVLADAGYKGQKNGPGPLNKAFLTPNPMLSSEEMRQSVQARDPLLIKLNSGGEYNLVDNPGKYSLIVASFYGKSQVKPTRFAEFDAQLATKKTTLDEAGLDAWQLVRVMRQQNIDAWVYHDRFRSVVTVGSFQTPKDPEVKKFQEAFCAKYKKHPNTGSDVLVSESIQLSAGRGKPPTKSWVMDPVPTLIEVPHLQKPGGSSGLAGKSAKLVPSGN